MRLMALLAAFSLSVSAQSVTRAGLTVTYRDPADRGQLARVFTVWQKAAQDLKAKGLTLPPATLTASRNASDFASLTGYPAHIAAITLKGNIYTQRLAALHAAIRAVLVEAIAAGGSSLRDHRQASGELGYFQHSFRVYDREGQPCARPGCAGTVRRIVQSGRSTWYCPTCQH